MSLIFVSHSSRDKTLAEAFVEFLRLGCNLQSSDIFASSVDGVGVPTGEDIISYVAKQLADSALVIQLITPAYYESPWCLCELGAQWAIRKDHYPLLVPPLNSEEHLRGVLSGTLVAQIDDGARLDELFQRISELSNAEMSLPVWTSAKSSFMEKLKTTILPTLQPLRGAESRAIDGMRAVLARATEKDTWHYTEDRRYTWVVDEHHDDHMLWQYETVVPANTALPWHRVNMDSVAPAPNEEKMRLSVVCQTKGYRAEAIRIFDQPKKIAYMVFFKPTLEGPASRSRRLKWQMTFHWPGFFDVLRVDREDVVQMLPRRPGKSGLMRVSFPTGWRSRARLFDRSPDKGTINKDLFQGRESLVWRIGNLEAKQPYRAHIRLE